jgi:glycosyltransferase involved in cell wall biosynthesis
MSIIPHGPYDHYRLDYGRAYFREASKDCFNLLYFGVIRPFKGLEDLITAFDSILQNEIDRYWLTIVGETWENWILPAELIARSHYRERITFINRYVSDEEVAVFFAGADAVVLPYHRSSASGPLHTAMSYELPIVVIQVGGLTEAVANYEGAINVPPRDPSALQRAWIVQSVYMGAEYK